MDGPVLGARILPGGTVWDSADLGVHAGSGCVGTAATTGVAMIMIAAAKDRSDLVCRA